MSYKLAEMLELPALRADPTPPPRHLPVSPPMAEYLDGQQRAGRKPSTIATARKHIAAAEARMGPLTGANVIEWEKYLADLAGRRNAQSTAQITRTLRRALRHAGITPPGCMDTYSRPDPLSPAWATALTDWQQYLRAAGKAPQTIKTRKHHLTRFAKSGAPLCPTLTTTQMMIEWLANNEWAPEYRYVATSSLRQFFNWFTEIAEKMETNPAAKLPTVKRPAPYARPMPIADLQTAIKETKDPRISLMLQLGAGYGLRRAEIAKIKSSDVSETRATTGAHYALKIIGKGNKFRQIPISSTMANTIRKARGYLFPGNYGDGHLSPAWVGRMISRDLPPGVTAHQARHLFATAAYRETSDLLTLQTLLGHASVETTRRYVETDPSTAANVVTAAANLTGMTTAAPTAH